MFINDTLRKIQNSKAGVFISNSLFMENIDTFAFVFLILTVVSTSFAGSGAIGALALAFCACCFLKALFKRTRRVELSFINKILIVYLLFVIISQMGATLFALSFRGILKTFVYMAFYFSAASFLSRNKGKILPVLFTIAGVCGVEAVIGILQNTAHVEAIATWQDTTRLADPTQAISRCYGTLRPYNPNLLAGYLLAGLSSVGAFIGFCKLKNSKRGLIFFSVLFIAVCYAIFVTGCRGAYIGLFGFFSVIALYIFKFAKKYRRRFVSLIGAGLIGICLVPSFFNRIISIFSFRGDSSISFRINVYKSCLEMFLDNKLLGIGVGNKNFREIYGLYMKTGYDALGAYCVPLEIAVESGIFALLSFTFYIVLAIIHSVKFTLDEKIYPLKRILVFCVLLTIAGVMFHGFFDTIFFRPQIQIIFWINMAIFHTLVENHPRGGLREVL